MWLVCDVTGVLTRDGGIWHGAGHLIISKMLKKALCNPLPPQATHPVYCCKSVPFL